jgi:hypothetical protein
LNLTLLFVQQIFSSLHRDPYVLPTWSCLSFKLFHTSLHADPSSSEAWSFVPSKPIFPPDSLFFTSFSLLYASVKMAYVEKTGKSFGQLKYTQTVLFRPLF